MKFKINDKSVTLKELRLSLRTHNLRATFSYVGLMTCNGLPAKGSEEFLRRLKNGEVEIFNTKKLIEKVLEIRNVKRLK